MGFDEPCLQDSGDDMIRTRCSIRNIHLSRSITLEELDPRKHFVRLRDARSPSVRSSQGEFSTPSGRCDFHAETLDYTPPVESRHGDGELRRKYPFELITPKNDDSMNSTFGHRDEVDRETATSSMSTRKTRRGWGFKSAIPPRIQRPRVLRADRGSRWRGAAGRACSAPSVRWAKRARQAWRERIDLGALERMLAANA